MRLELGRHPKPIDGGGGGDFSHDAIVVHTRPDQPLGERLRVLGFEHATAGVCSVCRAFFEEFTRLCRRLQKSL